MLSICTLKSASQASQYYQSESYYTKENEPGHSEWLGKGAEKLGLNGHVNVQEFKNLLEGHSPMGEKLIQTSNGKTHRPGYDLTFSAPKSVSILGIVGEDKRVMEAHRNAVKKVISSIESEYAGYRAKKNGLVNLEKTGNFTVAAFEHIDSRALDPNLHTHCVLMNLTQREDGAWRTIFGDDLYKNKLLNGMEYRAFLAEELMQKGFNIVQTSSKGTFELEGFEKSLIDQFSKRRRQITEKLEEVGFTGSKASAIANLDTRAEKQQVNLEELKKQWNTELKDCGSSIEWLNQYSQSSLDRGPVLIQNQKEIAESSVSAALNHLSEQQSVFNLNQIINASKGMSVMPCSEADLLKAIENKVVKSDLLYIGEGLLTTQSARNLEIDVISKMKQGKNQIRPMMSGFRASIQAYFRTDNAYQKEALKEILTNKDRQLLIHAESKKDLNGFISIYQEICKDNRFYPIGLTQAKANVEKLKERTGLTRVNTIEGFIKACEVRSEKINHKSGDSHKAYQARSVWIVDGELSLKQMNKLQDYSKQFGSRIIWTDTKGKSSAIYKTLIKSSISTSTIYQSNDGIVNKKANIAALENINKLENQDKIIHASTKNELHKKAIEAYIPKKDLDSVIISTTQADRLLINHQVREELKKTLEIGQESVKVEILHPLSFSVEQKKLAHCYQLGDILNFNKEKSYFQIKQIDIKQGIINLEDKLGNKISLETAKFNAKNIEIYRPDKREINTGDTLIWTKTIKDESNKMLDKISGEKAKVIQIDKDFAVVRLKNGKTSQLELNKMEHKHWDYGHAITLDKAVLQSFHHGVFALDGKKEMNSRTINGLNSIVQTTDNFHLVAHQLEETKQKIHNLQTETPMARDKKPEVYKEKEAILNQDKPINQSYFPRLEAGCKVYQENHKLMDDKRNIPTEQIKKACLTVDQVCSKLSEREAVFDLKSAKDEAFLVGGLELSKADINSAFDRAIQEGWVMPIDKNSSNNGPLMTTKSTFLAEKSCINLMKNGQESVGSIIAPQALNSIKEHAILTEGQKQAVELILTTSDRIVGVQGVAGSGKTTMLKEVKRFADDAGTKIIGLSNTASASNRMTEATTTLESAGIQSMTLSRFLNQAEKDAIYKNSLVILDEASLVSNKDMHQLLTLSDRLKARLVLVGDVKQMGAIEAGKPFYLLLGQGMKSACMTENVRFKNPETLKIMQDLYAAKIENAIEKLSKNIIEIPDREERLTKMSQEYLSKTKEQRNQTLIITPLNEDRLFVNQTIRQELKRAGELQGQAYSGHNLIQKDLHLADKNQIYSYELGDVVRFNNGTPSYAKVAKQDFKSNTLTLLNEKGEEFIWSPLRNLPYASAVEIYRQESRELMPGDKIIWRLNDEKKGIFNGNILEIKTVKGSAIELVSQEAKTFRLDLKETKNQHWDYAYAVTLPISQGKDVPYTLGHGESPKPYQKSGSELKIGDTVALKTPNSQIAKITHIDSEKMILKNRAGEIHQINGQASQAQKWDYYPPFSERKAHELPKSTSLNGLLVEATRGDNFKLFVDNKDYFSETLKAHQSIKQSAIEYFESNWPKISHSVDAMTAKISGKALSKISSHLPFKTDKAIDFSSQKSSIISPKKEIGGMER